MGSDCQLPSSANLTRRSNCDCPLKIVENGSRASAPCKRAAVKIKKMMRNVLRMPAKYLARRGFSKKRANSRSAVFRGRHEQDRPGRALQDSFGYAADEQVVHRTVAMPAHYNRIGPHCCGAIENFLDHRAGRLVQSYFQTSALQFLFPLREFGLLFLVRRTGLTNCLWHRNRHQLRHAERSVSKRG